MSKIGIISGGGKLPILIGNNLIKKNYEVIFFVIEDTFNKKPIPVRTGGSIPIVALFEKELGLKSILMGFGLDSDAIHSPNEHYGIFNYLKGIETIPYFFSNFTRVHKK